MKIFIKVKSNSKKEKIEKTNETNYLILTKKPPSEGKANRAVIKILAKYFRIPQINIKIISGKFSKRKIVKIS